MNQTVRIYGELKDELVSRKFAFKPVFDGNLFRFDRNGKIGSAWAVGKTATSAGKPIQMLMFGDFATGESYEWWSRKALTKEEAKDLAVQAAEERKKYQQAKKAKQKEAAGECKGFWQTIRKDLGPTPYGLRKGLFDLYGAGVEGEDLFVPIHTANGTLCNLQRIEADGTKRFWPGGAIRGNAFFVNGYPEKAPSTIYLAEGYSTGASIFEALRSRPSAALSPLQDRNDMGVDAPLGQSGRRDLPHASGMAQNAADNPTKDSGVPQAPRSYRCGNKDTGEKIRARDQGRRPTRADHRQRLEHQLLTALASTDAKRKQDERARHGGSQGLYAEQGSPRGNAGEVESAPGGNGRSGERRSGPGAGSDGPDAYSLSQPAALELPEEHLSQPGDNQRGDEALSGGIGATTFGIHRGSYPSGSEGCIKIEPRAFEQALQELSGRINDGYEDQRRGWQGIKHDDQGGGTQDTGVADRGSTTSPTVVKQLPGMHQATRPMASGTPDNGFGEPGKREIGSTEAKDRGSTGIAGDLGQAPLLQGRGSLKALRDLPRGEDFIVVCALNAGNLAPTARALHKRWPDARITVCGDDDRHTKKPDGTPFNPGREAALEAARSVGGLVSFPQFSGLELVSHLSDYNDLSLLTDGPARVLASLESATTPENAHLIDMVFEASQDIAKVGEVHQEGAKEESLISRDRKGNAVMPSARFVADRLLEIYDGRLIKQDKDLFHYTGTHWAHLGQHGIDQLSNLIQEMCDKEGSPTQIDAYIENLRRVAPEVPEGRNLFMADPWAANFRNGTLHVTRNCTRYLMEFRPHNRLDYLINVLPYDYRPAEELPVAEEFEEMLTRIFKGDPDWREKRRAVAQMFGACLVPMAPRLFMLFGPPGTGKSSLVKLAGRLMHADNTCSVDPSKFSGFNMEIMAGKLVNFVTDINTSSPLEDHIVKQIEDRAIMCIPRKFKTDIKAPLPAVHIFGGNAVPPTREGSSRAYGRRWTFLEFKQLVAIGKFDRDYADNLFKKCPTGMLRFSLEGLADLCESGGHFTQPESGLAALNEWHEMHDPVERFLSDVKAGELLDGNTILIVEKDAKIERGRLYILFRSYMEQRAAGAAIMHDKKFFAALRTKGFTDYKSHRDRCFYGLGVGVGPAAHV